MIKYYYNNSNDMVYWLDFDVVMCADEDLCFPLESSFTPHDFQESIKSGYFFEWDGNTK